MKHRNGWWIVALILAVSACGLEFPQVAVVDRIVHDEHAVLIVGDPPERELVVPLTALPTEAYAGAWLTVVLIDDQLVWAELDADATSAARARVREQLDALRERGRRLP